ncbi:MAG TPA: hypothetical protein VGP72_27305 [Planctomycetota bacterium]|jgi:hypothetical protein
MQSPSTPASIIKEIYTRRTGMFGLLLLGTCVLLYANWRAPLHNFDDVPHLYHAFGYSWREWFEPKPSISYNPVAMFSWAVDLKLFGDGRSPADGQPLDLGPGPDGQRRKAITTPPPGPFPFAVPPAWGMRLMNGLYHLLAGYVLWLLLRRLEAGEGMSALIALLWVAHPMACESVAWVCERKNVLVALFGFAALWACAEGRRTKGEVRRADDSSFALRPSNFVWWRWPAVAVFYTLAILSKSSAAGLLPLLAVLAVIDPGARTHSTKSVRRWLELALGLAVPVAITVIVSRATMATHVYDVVPPPGGSVWTAVLTDTEIFARYIKNILVPLDLSFFYGVQPVLSLSDPRPWMYGTLLVLICGGSIWLAERERRPLALLGLCWFFFALAPNANLVGVPYWMQDRYVYLAAPGFLLMFCCGLQGQLRYVPDFAPRVPAAACAGVGVIALLGAFRAPLFEHSDYYLLDAVARQPDSAMARLQAAEVLKLRFHRYSMAGDMPNPALARLSAKTLVSLYEGIEACPDLRCHIDAFTVRVRRAEALLSLDHWQESRAALGTVPPRDATMLTTVDEQGRKLARGRMEQSSGYLPRTLATAWGIVGESELRQSGQKDLPLAQRIEHTEQAIATADESINVVPHDYTAHVLKGRALICLADLFAEAQDMETALQHYETGISVLKSVPPGSRSFIAARMIVENVGPPEGPRR